MTLWTSITIAWCHRHDFIESYHRQRQNYSPMARWILKGWHRRDSDQIPIRIRSALGEIAATRGRTTGGHESRGFQPWFSHNPATVRPNSDAGQTTVGFQSNRGQNPTVHRRCREAGVQSQAVSCTGAHFASPNVIVIILYIYRERESCVARLCAIPLLSPIPPVIHRRRQHYNPVRSSEP